MKWRKKQFCCSNEKIKKVNIKPIKNVLKKKERDSVLICKT